MQFEHHSTSPTHPAKVTSKPSAEHEVTLSRAELFNLVWSEAVSKIAPRLGMSDRGLAKLCSRHNIPLPSRGYWAKVKGGKYPARLPLPRPDEDYQISFAAHKGANADHGLDLQSAMQRLFHRTPLKAAASEVGQVAVKTPPATNVCEKPLNIASSVSPIATSAKHQLVSEAKSVLDAEYERAVAAGLEYQRRQAAQALLGALVSSVHTMDEATSTAVLTWARSVHTRLSLVDPVGAVISEILATNAVVRKG
jgi:hypothetical protein